MRQNEEQQVIRRVIGAYDSTIARAYCRVRFQILRQRFLEEIGQYLPSSGPVVDIGCGFGLFALYFAMTRPGIEIFGLDRQPRRIEMARVAARRLGVRNAHFEVGDAETYLQNRPIQAAYMLDIIHHVRRESVHRLLSSLNDALVVGGRLVVKDIETHPAYKRWFTWLLDKVMDVRAPVDYWSNREVLSLLQSLGLVAFKHSMLDYLPYPHVIYIAVKPEAALRADGCKVS